MIFLGDFEELSGTENCLALHYLYSSKDDQGGRNIEDLQQAIWSTCELSHAWIQTLSLYSVVLLFNLSIPEYTESVHIWCSVCYKSAILNKKKRVLNYYLIITILLLIFLHILFHLFISFLTYIIFLLLFFSLLKHPNHHLHHHPPLPMQAVPVWGQQGGPEPRVYPALDWFLCLDLGHSQQCGLHPGLLSGSLSGWQ